MPVVWESPVPIEVGPAESLANYVVNKAGLYANRTIERPVEEFTQEDAEDDIVVVWWVLVRRDWDDFKRRSKKPEIRYEAGRKVERWPLWAPSIMHFGDTIAERIDRYQREEYDAREVAAARAELQRLVGFSAYAYFKHELR